MEAVRVQVLAKESIHELPAQFARPTHERPQNSKAIEGAKIPVISLSKPREILVNEISKACHEWGFFIITDHGISPSLIRRLRVVGQEFFELPQEEKEKYANDPSIGKLDGYGTKMTKNMDEKVEWVDYLFHLMHPPSRVSYANWPNNPPSYRPVTEEYNAEILRLTGDLLELLSEGLGLERNILESSIGGCEEMELEMKINMYPPCPQPELALGVEPHTDMSALTLLISNGVPGLHIWKDDAWFAVSDIPDALFVNVGDQIEVLSNGKYKSVLHRSVVNKDRVRMSWAVFCAPPREAIIGPLPQLIDDETPPKFSPKSFAEYRFRKFNKLPQ